MLIKFDYEDTVHGPAVTIDGTQITRGCATPAEVDAVIAATKVDLDRVAALMKKRTAVYGSEPLI